MGCSFLKISALFPVVLLALAPAAANGQSPLDSKGPIPLTAATLALGDDSFVFTTFEPVPGAQGTYARKINNRGQVIGSYYFQGKIRAFLREADGSMVLIAPPDDPDYQQAYATGISESGQVAGYYIDRSGGSPAGFIRSVGGIITTIRYPGPGTIPTEILDMNAAGDVVGWYSGYDPWWGFLRHANGEFVSFGYPNAEYTIPMAINDRGQVVGYFVIYPQLIERPFLRERDGRLLAIGPPALDASCRMYSVDINNFGQIVQSYFCATETGSNYRSYLREPDGKFVGIEFPGGVWTVAQGMNERGEIVGAYLTGQGYPQFLGFLRYADGTFSKIEHPEGFNFSWAFGINDRGQIVGVCSKGTGEGFVATRR